MSFSIADRLLQREIRDPYRAYTNRSRKLGNGAAADRSTSYASHRGLYGDKTWVEELDIVNELGGHTGCVNALCWSSSGRLLASGSDDTHLNIHTYQPDASSRPFTLSTTVATGHSANIFSVKFMPHSNDRTVVCCAGDDQVRVFDVEHDGQNPSQAHILPSSTRHHSGVNLEELYRGVQYLTPAMTNGRVYRSHSDRVKRIITESSPNLFLTCSEDGEVRQWDLRLPSAAYPAPRRGQQVPPPLISYKRFQLDLNTISCSGNQPHYIVLGGGHLHAFLHDRRMLGRDVASERGSPSYSHSSANDHDEELMGQATKCVRRFAPHGKSKMTRTDGGHITACKISDAYPDEMIGSWSGDHIYSFNLVSSPDALDKGSNFSGVSSDSNKAAKNKRSMDERARAQAEQKKQKRERASPVESSSSSAEGRTRGRVHAGPSGAGDASGTDVALRVRYGNGQSEDIPLEPSPSYEQRSQARTLTRRHRSCVNLAKNVAKVRSSLFSEAVVDDDRTRRSSAGHALKLIKEVLSQMEDISRDWRYPMSPSPETVALQQGMRADRASACRFLQAAGAVERASTMRPESPRSDSAASSWLRFKLVENPAAGASSWQKFCYTFLRAIVSWSNDGAAGLVASFKPSERDKYSFSVRESSGVESIDDLIIPHLRHLAGIADGQKAIVDVHTNRFETDENRVLFTTATEAVDAFSRDVQAFEARQNHRPGASEHERDPNLESTETAQLMSESTRNAASGEIEDGSSYPEELASLRRFWTDKVSRGVLLSAGEEVNFMFVNRAFGGPRVRAELGLERNQEEIDVNEPDDLITEAELLNFNWPEVDMEAEWAGQVWSNSLFGRAERQANLPPGASDTGGSEAVDDVEMTLGELDDDDDSMTENFNEHDILSEIVEEWEVESSDDDHNDYEDDEDEDEDDDDGEQDGLLDSEDEIDPRTLFTSAGTYGRNKENVEANVPCSAHTRVYSGHCNVKTVKDVNFYGRDDEYVVSGSDSGHLFIWDRKTSKLLNILQGDGEVVNVIQGHPFEPMLAVSGIDHTIKIFSPDLRAQHNARHGLDLGTSQHRSHGVSRLHMRSRIRRNMLDPQDAGRWSGNPSDQHTPSTTGPASEAAFPGAGWDEDDDGNIDDERPTNGGLASCKRMKDSYAITSQNDSERQGGMEDAVLTRSFLAQLATRIYQQRRLAQANTAGGQGGDGLGGEGGGGVGGGGEDEGDDQTIVMRDDCILM